MENSVFARQSSPLDRTLSAGAYNLVIGLTLCWGFWVNWWMVGNIPVESIRSIHPWLFFGGYFASCLTGAWLFHSSNKPWVSFLGYNLVVVPFGLIVNLVVSRYDSALVHEAIRITALVTLGMMAFGTLFPRFFASIANESSFLPVFLVEPVKNTRCNLELHGGVVAMIDLLFKYLGKELSEVEVDKKNVQALTTREPWPTALRSVQR